MLAKRLHLSVSKGLAGHRSKLQNAGFSSSACYKNNGGKIFSLTGQQRSEAWLVCAGLGLNAAWTGMKRLRPRANRSYLLCIQQQIVVGKAVGKGRHSLFLNFLANSGQAVVCCFGPPKSFPVFKIHVPPAFVDVISHYP